MEGKTEVKWVLLVGAGLAVLSLLTCSPHPPVPFSPSSEQNLYDRIDDLANQLTENLPGERQLKIAVIEFPDQNKNITGLGRFLSEELTVRLFQTAKFGKIIERALLYKVIEEHELGLTGLLDEATVKEVGALLGVDAIATGTITDLGEKIRINARLIDIEKGVLLAAGSIGIRKDHRITEMMSEILESFHTPSPEPFDMLIDQLVTEISGRPTLAILEFIHSVKRYKTAFGPFLREEFGAKPQIRANFRIIEHQEIDRIEREYGPEAVHPTQVGRDAGAEVVLTGTYSIWTGGQIRIHAELIDVEGTMISEGNCFIPAAALPPELHHAIDYESEGFRQSSPSDLISSEMAGVPGGEYWIGTDDISDNSPRRVDISSFWIDKFEVTNQEFAEFVHDRDYKTKAETNGSCLVVDQTRFTSGSSQASWRKPDGPGSSTLSRQHHPVVQVAWEDADAYCRWRGKRLPTEEEWEVAANGISGRKNFPWGNGFSKDRANYGHSHGTMRVGSFAGNSLGIYDMAGNVWEWCSSSYSPIMKVVRGGGWESEPETLKNAFRGYFKEDQAKNSIGFRCAKD